ncbi:hypothetical protein JEK38_10040 [Klebsiella pneumoniae]|uniref:hypothetical protein n=1 Tax=Klebsiella pneumoniae TaxID=573 RepID=UPI0021198DAF|nr:hypothetical protein [Klebsiella pneumoniae]MCQ8380406.1 hypothetical protein [Klebsiella pneumoniae]MCQ8568333.1 hypothetical protein [Klebsiella pneumoniae]
MVTNSSIDLTKLSKEELIELYEKHKSSNIAHQLWCLTHPDIPVNFSSEFVKLIEKLEKLVELNSQGETSPDILLDALIDSIYSDCRGLFCEKSDDSKNYTLQNCLKIANENDAVTKIDAIIHRKEFSDEIVCDYSFWKWVKFVTDKAIVHKDNLTEDKKKIIEYRYQFLNNGLNVFDFQYYIVQIHNIYVNVVECFAEDLLSTYNKSKL